MQKYQAAPPCDEIQTSCPSKRHLFFAPLLFNKIVARSPARSLISLDSFAFHLAKQAE